MPTPVHDRPHGQTQRRSAGCGGGIHSRSLPPSPLTKSLLGLLGGKGWTLGHRSVNDKLSKRVTKVWTLQRFQHEPYSEIPERKFSVTGTVCTLDFIDAAYGFDLYLLMTPKEDLCSKFGLDLKQGLLLQLVLWDPQRRAAVYHKCKEFVIQDVGLTLDEAVEKQRLWEEKDPVQLFEVCVDKRAGRPQQQALSEPAVVQKRASA